MDYQAKAQLLADLGGMAVGEVDGMGSNAVEAIADHITDLEAKLAAKDEEVAIFKRTRELNDKHLRSCYTSDAKMELAAKDRELQQTFRRTKMLREAKDQQLQELRQRVEELEKQSCVVCKASLHPLEPEPPHCEDCHVTDEQREDWEDEQHKRPTPPAEEKPEKPWRGIKFNQDLTNGRHRR